MKRDKSWLDELSGTLRETETPPPAGGWERLRNDLPEVPKGTRFILHRPRVAAVAAVVLVCVAAGDAFRRARIVSKDDVRVVASSAAADSLRPGPGYAGMICGQDDAGTVLDAEEFRKMRAQRAAFAAAPVRRVLKTHAEPTLAGAAAGHGTSPTADAMQTASAAGCAGAERVPASDGAGTDDTTAGKGLSAKEPRPRPSAPARANDWGAVRSEEPVKSRRKVALGLFAGGGVVASGHAGARSGSLMSNKLISGIGTNPVKYDYDRFAYNHKLPLSFGLTFGKEFAHGLTVESGVVYSLLRSEAFAQYGGEKLRQRLHFIGIPVRLNWRLADRAGLSLYIGAGAMVEKCISAHFGSESVSEKGVQGSVFAAAGIQYRLGGPASVYLEPEISYYFTQTRLRTARNDSPACLSLHLGVRFSF